MDAGIAEGARPTGTVAQEASLDGAPPTSAPSDGALAHEARPLSPTLAWGLIDVLEGGAAAWLDLAGRHEVDRWVRSLAGASADRWRSVLSERSLVVECWAGWHALEELDRAPGEVLFIARCAPGATGRVEMYADTDAWMQVQSRVLIGAEVRGPMNLVARVPQGVWPFAGAVGPCALAADALEHPDPDVVAGGEATLNAAAAALVTGTAE